MTELLQKAFDEAAKLPREEQEQLRLWLEDYFEDQLELKDDQYVSPSDEAVEEAMYWLGYLRHPDNPIVEIIERDPNQPMLPGIQ